MLYPGDGRKSKAAARFFVQPHQGASMLPLRVFSVAPNLPASLAPLRELAHNHRFSWSPGVEALFEEMDPVLWDKSYKNPV